MNDSNGTTTSAPDESAERTPGTERPPRDLIFLVAGRLYAQNHSINVDMMPWSIDKALSLWKALDNEIRKRGWLDLL